MGMAENIECKAVAAETLTHDKIKAFNMQIVVSGEPNKPYYNISYYDIAKKEWYIAYGSYFLENVYKWLFEWFEEVDCDMVEVVRCKDCTVPHNSWTGCPKLNGLVPPPDFYCAYGERKNDD